MPTHPDIEPARAHRVALVAGLFVGLAILVITQDQTGKSPYLLLGLALCIAVYGYLRRRPRRSWEGNDEPYG